MARTKFSSEQTDITSGGSSSNGYSKLPDGTLICYARLTITSTTPRNVTWTFPHAFSSTPTVVAMTDNYLSNMRPVQADNTSTTSAQFVMFNQGNTLDYGDFSAHAIGRWK